MKPMIKITLLALMALLAGCAGFGQRPPPPPISQQPAVIALYEGARNDTAAGRLDAAGASLERALRIEPRNPGLWQELAKLRLQQGQYDQALSLAAKSNAFAGENKALRAGNWRVTGEARSRLGDTQGAQAAFDKAAELER